jgi:dTDP-4-amino-4,6-dideoxygalactose transaminase
MRCTDRLAVAKGMFSVAERVGRQIVSLSMFYAINEKDAEGTCAALCGMLTVSSKLR